MQESTNELSILKVRGNNRLLGPFYIQLMPVISTYSGVTYNQFKKQLKMNAGRYKNARLLFDGMHRTTKYQVLRQLPDCNSEKYSPFIYYFEYLEDSPGEYLAIKCHFPKIFPDEDVQILESKIIAI